MTDLRSSGRPYAPQSGRASESEFPSARYFQTHFEYLHETLARMAQELAVLKTRIDGLDAALRSEPQGAEPVPERFETRRDN
jgi:hypothetical protein